MIEIVDSPVIGPLLQRAALWVNGNEIAVTSCENDIEAAQWAAKVWAKTVNEIGLDEIKRLNWTHPELRIYS